MSDKDSECLSNKRRWLFGVCSVACLAPMCPLSPTHPSSLTLQAMASRAKNDTEKWGLLHLRGLFLEDDDAPLLEALQLLLHVLHLVPEHRDHLILSGTLRLTPRKTGDFFTQFLQI